MVIPPILLYLNYMAFGTESIITQNGAVYNTPDKK
jgi:hypothetical protein